MAVRTPRIPGRATRCRRRLALGISPAPRDARGPHPRRGPGRAAVPAGRAPRAGARPRGWTIAGRAGGASAGPRQARGPGQQLPRRPAGRPRGLSPRRHGRPPRPRSGRAPLPARAGTGAGAAEGGAEGERLATGGLVLAPDARETEELQGGRAPLQLGRGRPGQHDRPDCRPQPGVQPADRGLVGVGQRVGIPARTAATSARRRSSGQSSIPRRSSIAALSAPCSRA